MDRGKVITCFTESVSAYLDYPNELRATDPATHRLVESMIEKYRRAK